VESPQRRYVSSNVAAISIQLSRALFDFGGRIVLNRLLVPGERGTYDLAIAVLAVLAVVRDLGLPYQLLRDERRPYGAVLRLSLASGAVLGGLLFVASPLFSFFSDPGLPGVLRVFAVWLLVDGLVAVLRTYFERELLIARSVLPEVLRGATAAAVAIGLAATGWGVWSLVAGDLVGAGVLALALWHRAAGRMPLGAGWSLVPDLVRRSRYLWATALGFLLVTNVDKFIVGRFGTPAAVGLYAQAWSVAFLAAVFAFPRGVLPALTEAIDRPLDLFATFRVGAAQLLCVQVLASYFLVFNAEGTLRGLYGERWVAATPLLAALAFVPLFDWFASLGGEVLKARHEDRRFVLMVAVDLVTLVVVGVWMTARWGPLGMAFANYFPLGRLWLAIRIARIFGSSAWTLLADVAVVVLAPLPLFAAASLFPAASWQRAAASVGAALLTVPLFVLRFRGPLRHYLRVRARGGEGTHA